MEALIQRRLIKQVRENPELAGVFEVPQLALPTVFLIFASIGGFFMTTYWYLEGFINPVWVVLINSALIFYSFTPIHEATHRSLSSKKKINDWLGTMSAQLILPGFNTELYRYLHVAGHHRYTGEILSDPDLPFLSGPLHRRIVRWVFLDILWTKFYFSVWSQRPRGERIRFVVGLFFYLSVFFLGLTSEFLKEFIVCYVLPLALGRIVLVYLFADIHHPEGVEQKNDPIGATGMIRDTNFLQRLLMLGQARHLMHHTYPGLPWYRYDKVWEVAKEVFPASQIKWGTFLTGIK